MTSDPLRRLTAGLAEEERIARAATSGPWRTITASGRTPAVYEQDWLIATPQGYDDVSGYVGERHPDFIDAAANAEHMALQDPKATLDRVEAIRKVIEAEIDNLVIIDGEWGDACSRDDIRAGKCMDRGNLANSGVLVALASIYPEDADETGAP